MDQQPIRYSQLRLRQNWIGVALSGLVKADDGTLSLSPLPGPVDGKTIVVAGPYELAPSGIAIGPCNDLIISNTVAHQLIWRDGNCKERELQLGQEASNTLGQFNNPTALLIHSDFLYVADSGNHRVQIFRLPTLELHSVWTGPLARPTGLATDSQGRIYVLDEDLKTIIRFSDRGWLDPSYNLPDLGEPTFLTLDGQDRLYVSDANSNQVLRLDPDGTGLRALSRATPSFRPRALSARADRLYIADADSGQIWAFDTGANNYLEPIPGYRGPVSALSIPSDESLWIKPGNDHVYYQLPSRQLFTSKGILNTTEPLDAGEKTNWARVHVDVEIPSGTSVRLQLIAGNTDVAPTEEAWKKVDVLPVNTLVPPLVGPTASDAFEKRFLWIRVLVTSELSAKSPRLFQIEAETASPGYLDHLPAVYRRADSTTGFLERFLKLPQSEIDDWEARLESMPQRFDPLLTREDQLAWLANWLAFPLPRRLSANEQRVLFARIPELYARRGTPSGICELAELYTGARPKIFEAFHERRVWQLGQTSALGIDTKLPSALPEGIIVPGWSIADPELFGLRGDYYDGVNFQRLRATRIDAELDLDLVKAPPPLDTAKAISVRWTGQLQPRSTDLYTLSLDTTGGVRLWIDGRLIIDSWNLGTKQATGRLSLSMDRWYAVVLEYFSIDGGGLHFSWSSRNQRKEIIPHERVYAVRDEHANLGGPSALADSCPVLVGQMVVGESQPLTWSDYGESLFDDTAHLFTVSIPGCELPTAAQREELRAVIEQEKPAHSDYHLCFLEPRMRVGFQARIGIDSIVAGLPISFPLDEMRLGVESYLGDDNSGFRVGSHGLIGHNTVLG